MPPVVALSFCLAFIAMLLVREVMERRVSLAVWPPTLVLMILGSRSWSQWFGFDHTVVIEDGLTEGSPLDRFFYLVVIACCWLVASYRGVKWTKLFSANPAITCFYVYFALSVLWADEPFGSFKRWFKDFGLIFITALILSEKDPLSAIRAVYARCAIVLFPLSVLFIKYYPNLGRVYTQAGDPMLTGVTTQKNSLGEIVMIFVLFLFWDYLEHRAASRRRGPWIGWDRVMLIAMGAWLLRISESKTALICLLIGATVLVVNGRFASRAANRILVCGAMAVPFFLLLTQAFAPFIAPMAATLGRDVTFTGRTDIWQHVQSGTWANPVFGAGFFNFWGSDRASELREVMGTPMLSSAHNGYLDIFLDGGVIGVSLLFIVLFGQARRVLREPVVDSHQRLKLAVLIVAILYNLSESAFGRLVPTWFTAMLVFIDFRTAKSAAAAFVERRRVSPTMPIQGCGSATISKGVPRHPIHDW